MKYWLDTEFYEDGKTIDLISIGIVAEDGREYYAENKECDLRRVSEWVQQNVLPHLHQCDGGYPATSCAWRNKVELRADLREFCDPAQYGPIEFWGYYADYDWVVLCQLFGTMMDLPGEQYRCSYCGESRLDKEPIYCSVLLNSTTTLVVPGWPMYCRDIKQLCDDLGNPKLPEQGKGEHHALADARWNKLAWEFLKAREAVPA